MGTDILLVTATRTETRAVCDAFEVGDQPNAESIDGRVYFDLGTLNGASVRLTQCEMGAGGLHASQQAVSKGLAALSPAAVIMVGIAFGVNEKTQSIGDVLVSERLRPYDLQRVGTASDGTTNVILRDDKPHASSTLINLLRSSELTWDGGRIRFGTVLTGAKLVDNVDLREQLRAFDGEAIGGEMEGGGLYVACQDEKVDWILVKSICDFADGRKAEDKEERQRLAAVSAVKFVRHALSFAKVNWHKRQDAQRVDELLTQVLELAVHGASTPLQSSPINARYFFLDTLNGKPILRRHNRLLIERNVLAGEHGLDYADLAEDKLVICDAFNSNSPKFKTLEPPEERNYGPRLKGQIDNRQKWALGVPVLIAAQPRGVLCFYSIRDVADENEQQVLLDIASRVARIFATALRLCE